MLRRPEERQETVEPPSTARRLLLVRILEAVGSKRKWSVRKLPVCWLTFPDLGSRPRDRHTRYVGDWLFVARPVDRAPRAMPHSAWVRFVDESPAV